MVPPARREAVAGARRRPQRRPTPRAAEPTALAPRADSTSEEHAEKERPGIRKVQEFALGQLYHCLKNRRLFDELAAFPPPGEALGAAAA